MPQPIDAVIAWVDGNDPALKAKQLPYIPETANAEIAAPERYADCNEIYYCISAILVNAPFISRIFIVTDTQIPPVIAQIAAKFGQDAADKIHLVDNMDIFAGYEDVLPTFNSITIETMLNRIPDIPERNIYLSDDFIIAKPVVEKDFFIGDRPVLRDHIPHPFYRPDLDSYFAENDEVLPTNIQYRLRDSLQFDPMALACNLDILKGDPTIKDISLTFLKASAKTLQKFYLWRKKRSFVRKGHAFICVQSLNEDTPATRTAIVAWLEEVIFGK